MPGKTLGHLAAAGITGTQKEHFDFPFSLTLFRAVHHPHLHLQSSLQQDPIDSTALN